MVDNIVTRLFSYLDYLPDNRNFILKFKFGFDGTTANKYKHKFNDKDDGTEDYILCTTAVPLQLIDENSKEIFWNNPQPSSTRFCSPIRIQYIKKTAEKNREEERYLREKITGLQDVCVSGRKVKFEFFLNMIDGKVSIT